MNRIDSLLARVLLFMSLAFAVSGTDAGELRLPELMQILAQTKTSKATFTEKKFIGIIDVPLESSGELEFTAPDKLTKRTLKPKPESLVLEGDDLTVERPGKRTIRVRLGEYPEVSAFIESIRGTLAGNLSALEEYYKLDLGGAEEKWKLVLLPRQSRMKHIVSRIEIEGSHADIKLIGFEMGDGDRSEMVITKANSE